MRMIRLFALMFVLLAPAAAFASNGGDKASQWNIDRSHSSVTFTVRHFFTPVTGKFGTFTIDMNFDPATPASGAITAEIDVNSIDTGSEGRDRHLRNPDFFEVEKYPKMSFKSTSITNTGENAFVLTGQLTVKEVTQNIEIPFTLLGIQDDPRRENTERAGFEGSFKMKRLEYGVGTGDWVSTAVVGDEVTVNIFLSVTRAKQ